MRSTLRARIFPVTTITYRAQLRRRSDYERRENQRLTWGCCSVMSERSKKRARTHVRELRRASQARRAGCAARRARESGSRPVSRVLSWATIPLGCTSPCTSSDLPGNTRGPRAAGRSKLRPTCSPIWPCSGRGLPCRACYQARGALLPHRFTLASRRRTCGFGGLLSVALSVGSRPPGVTWRPALWSPDFPPAAEPRAVAWPTPGCTIGPGPRKLKGRRSVQPAGGPLSASARS